MPTTKCRIRSSSGTGKLRTDSQKSPEAQIDPPDNGRSASEREGQLSLAKQPLHRKMLAPLPPLTRLLLP